MTYKTGDIVRIKGLRDTTGKITNIRHGNMMKNFYEIELPYGHVMFLSAASIELYEDFDLEPATDDDIKEFYKCFIK